MKRMAMNEKELKEGILKEIQIFGRDDAKRILGNLPEDFINQFLEGKSLFKDILEKAIDLTIKKRNAEVEQVIKGLQRWNEVELKKGVGMKKSKTGYFINYYELLQELGLEE